MPQPSPAAARVSLALPVLGFTSKLRELLDLLAALREIREPLTSPAGLRASLELLLRLAEFAGPELSPDTWHTLAVAADGATITCFVDGRSVGTAEDSTLATGRAGVSTLAMSGAYFANLQVYGR